MPTTGADDDKAGREYWDRTWDVGDLPPVWDVESRALRHHVEREFFGWLARSLRSFSRAGHGSRVVEVGCARSQVLPLLARRLGLEVAGIDYSQIGCDQTAAIMRRERVEGVVHCCDVFNAPEHLLKSFDAVMSFGLVEHFSDTSKIVSALAALLKPGGVMLTSVPNMCGATGAAQRLLNREIFDIHVKLTPSDLAVAHRSAGLEVLEAEYFLSSNFGVVNVGANRSSGLRRLARRTAAGTLSRISMGIWLWERLAGAVGGGRALSPYVNCVAVKP